MLCRRGSVLAASGTGRATLQRAPKKSLGQHFLRDRNILGAVADAAEVGSDDLVVEVGSGEGTLTNVIAERARRVVAIELDPELAERLAIEVPANVEVVQTDARRVNPERLLGECLPYKLVGNLPYYAAMPILRAFLESSCRPRAAAVLVQREVAQQLCSGPGAMSLASLGVQIFGNPRITRTVKPGSFRPPPKVFSSVVAIDVYDSPAADIDDTGSFFELARAAFSAPRKQLRNALAGGLGIVPALAETLLDSSGIDPRRRAETLSIPEWGILYQRWSGRAG